MNSYEKVLQNEKYKKRNIYLFVLIMLDFLLTYIGVNIIGIVYEANPLMVWLFELPLWQGFIIRTLYGCFIITLSTFLYKNRYEHYNAFINFALGVNIFVLFMHIRWAFVYFINTI